MKTPPRWKRRFLFLLGTGAVFGGLFGGFYFSTHHMPEFYREALSDSKVTVQSAEEFQQLTSELLGKIEESPDWTESFTEQQINSWLAYEFPELDQDLVPPEVSQPRVRLKDGYILTACRYEGEEFSGILSLKVRPRVTENHELVLELSSLKAGLVPIPLERIIEEVNKENDLQGWSLNLLELEDEDVLLISHDSSDHAVPKLASIDVDEEQITIRGEKLKRDEDHPRFTRSLDQAGSSSRVSN